MSGRVLDRAFEEASAVTSVRDHAQAPVVRWRGGVRTEHEDLLAEEVPVALVVNGISHAVMLATPDDLEEFAYGFMLTEGLIESELEFRGAEAIAVELGIEVRIEVSPACEMRLKARRRTLAGRTGCGLCGVDSLAEVRLAPRRVGPTTVHHATIAKALDAIRGHQRLGRLTGATHASAWATVDGEIALVREDVGRHNSLDKLAGALRAARIDAARGFVLVTSRASFEMVQKCARLGVGLLAAVSAPTALAVRTALDCELALAGFVRGNDLVAYTCPERFGLGSPPTSTSGVERAYAPVLLSVLARD